MKPALVNVLWLILNTICTRLSHSVSFLITSPQHIKVLRVAEKIASNFKTVLTCILYYLDKFYETLMKQYLSRSLQYNLQLTQYTNCVWAPFMYIVGIK